MSDCGSVRAHVRLVLGGFVDEVTAERQADALAAAGVLRECSVCAEQAVEVAQPVSGKDGAPEGEADGGADR
jgi:hypothetical protein